MRLSTRMRYGTRAMVDLALYHGKGPLAAVEIATRQDVSPKYLESILAEIRHAGLLRSVRGAQGGYVLTRPPSEINLAEIYLALEGAQGLVECCDSPEICTRSANCVTQEVWSEMYDACLSMLQAKTLQDLVLRSQVLLAS